MSMREYASVMASRIQVWLAAVGEFGRWWWDELLGLLPEPWQRHLRQLGNSLIIELDEQHANLSFGNLSSAEPLQQVSLEQLRSTQSWPDEAARVRAAKAAQIILLLPEQHALRKVVSLPLATEGKLDNVLRFEMDRYTPFNGEQVYFGYRQLRHGRSRERVEVDMIVVQREYLDPLLNALIQVQLPPSIVSLRASSDAASNLINLLSGKRGLASGSGWKGRRLSSALVLGAILLLLIGPFYQQQRHLQRLQGEVQQLKVRAEQARGLGGTVESLQSNRDFLLSQQAMAAQTLLLLDELTALLPDTTWLNRFEDNGSSLRLDGESGEASALISLLEGSALLKNVRFASPVTTSPGTSRERFSLVAERIAAEAMQ